MGKINDIIGENLRGTRAQLSLSAETVAKLAESAGLDISPGTIRRYERGEQKIPAEDVIMLAVAMDISHQQLVAGADPRQAQRKPSSRPIRSLRQQDSGILMDLATKWDGDIHALLLADAIYATLPVSRRREIIMDLLLQLEAAVRSEEIKLDDLPDGLIYLQQYAGGMYDKK